jgi:hypothetical protein
VATASFADFDDRLYPILLLPLEVLPSASLICCSTSPAPNEPAPYGSTSAFAIRYIGAGFAGCWDFHVLAVVATAPALTEGADGVHLNWKPLFAPEDALVLPCTPDPGLLVEVGNVQVDCGTLTSAGVVVDGKVHSERGFASAEVVVGNVHEAHAFDCDRGGCCGIGA